MNKFLPLIALLLLTACAGKGNLGDLGDYESPMASSGARGTYKVGEPYQIDGITYYPREDYNYDETGIASWYGPGFHGRYTANGEAYDQNQLTAAHRTLPMPSLVRVTNLENGKSIVVRVNDRGPFSRGRIIDMSKRGAELLGFKGQGTAKVRVQILAEESRAIAEAAREKGTYYAGRATPDTMLDVEMPERTARLEESAIKTSSIEAEELAPIDAPAKPSSIEIGHNARTNAYLQVEKQEVAGRYLPEQKVEQRAALPGGGQIYVQAGAFSKLENAEKLAKKLGSIGQTSISNVATGGQTFHRVRLGPFANPVAADKAMTRVINAGEKSARIVVDR